ncbi:MAG: hypothetical protein WEA04_04715 [Candidatus Andersenbacteria bacterium]
MAGEVGHVVYAARLLTFLGDQVHDTAYWTGTLFPDIRHLGVVSRHRTHPKDVTIHTLVGENDFHTGMRVHAWVDYTREKFLRDVQIKERLPWHPFVPFCLKLLEDELLYAHFDDWNLIQRALTQIQPEELHYSHQVRAVKEWHVILQRYFKHKPTAASRFELAQAIGLSEAMAREINSVVKLLHTDGRAQKLFERFWQHLEDILR